MWSSDGATFCCGEGAAVVVEMIEWSGENGAAMVERREWSVGVDGVRTI
jgi:hypothetical protein